MDTGCLEIVVKRANNPLKKTLQIVAAALAVVCVLGLFVFGVFSLIGAVLFAALAWYLSQDLNIDYEYAYVDRELRVAKIINKSRRKEVAVYDLNEMEVMAPEKSHHLDSHNNRNLPVTDYSSHMEPARPGIRYRVCFPDKILVLDLEGEYAEEIFRSLRTYMPRKIFRD